jgi:hypothetical protein
MADEPDVPPYKYRGLPLSPSIIAELLSEQIADGRLPSTFQRSDVAQLIERIHVDRGGLRSSTDLGISVKKALSNLRECGVLEQPVGKYWRVVATGGGSAPFLDVNSTDSLESSLADNVAAAVADARLIIEEEIGEGETAVYVYYFANDRRLAEMEGRDIWECKVGMTVGDVTGRVLGQLSQTAVHSLPIVGLVIRTPEARHLETALHGLLRAAGAHCKGSATGAEWFRTSPTKVKELVNEMALWIDRLRPGLRDLT